MMVSIDLRGIAGRFVDLALRPGVWKADTVLSEADIVKIFEVVAAAGFEPKGVVPGKLTGDYLEQDGSRTGETYPINGSCPYKVIAENGKVHYLATGWLNDLAYLVSDLTSSGKPREEVGAILQAKIEMSVPLRPVQLTKDGDLLQEYPKEIPSYGAFRYLVARTRDNDALGSCVGIHKHCRGWMDRRGATETHDAIVCRSCHLRVLFPREVTTYGELRAALGFQTSP